MVRSISALVLVCVVIGGPALAQEYPVSSEIYLSFEPNRHVPTRNVAPGEEFGVFWVRDPDTDEGSLISITAKRLPALAKSYEQLDELRRLLDRIAFSGIVHVPADPALQL